MPEVVAREQYEDCADALRALPGVRAVDVLDDDARLDRPCIEVVVGPGYERTPPRVLRAIAEYDFGVRSVTSRGQPRHFVVVVI